MAGNNSPYAGWARFSRGGYPGTYLYQPSDPSGVQANSTVISPVERVTLSLNLGYDLTLIARTPEPNVRAQLGSGRCQA